MSRVRVWCPDFRPPGSFVGCGWKGYRSEATATEAPCPHCGESVHVFYEPTPPTPTEEAGTP